MANPVKGGAVINAGANKRQPQRHVHRLAETQCFERNQRLIMVATDHGIVTLAHGGREYRVGRQRFADLDALIAGKLRSRLKNIDLFTAKMALLASVRIQGTQPQFRLGDIEPAA